MNTLDNKLFPVLSLMPSSITLDKFLEVFKAKSGFRPGVSRFLPDYITDYELVTIFEQEKSAYLDKDYIASLRVRKDKEPMLGLLLFEPGDYMKFNLSRQNLIKAFFIYKKDSGVRGESLTPALNRFVEEVKEYSNQDFV